MDQEHQPQRKSPRLKEFDYSDERMYFVTICTFQRAFHFGNIRDDTMELSAIGELASEDWQKIPEHFDRVELDTYIVMPNHVHGILAIQPPRINSVGTRLGASDKTTTPLTLSKIINLYKGGVTRKAKELLGENAPRLWQGRYHDHVIRNEDDLQRIRAYIEYNPAKWNEDRYYADS